MLGWVAGGSVRWGPGARRRAAGQVGCRCRCRPLWWRVVGQRVWWPGRRGSVAEAVWAAEDMVALKQLLEVVAGSWGLAVRMPKEGWKDMAEVHLGVTARMHSRTLAVLEVAVRHEGSWDIQGSCCASLQRMRHLPLVVPVELVPPGLSVLTMLRLAAVVERPVPESAMKS